MSFNLPRINGQGYLKTAIRPISTYEYWNLTNMDAKTRELVGTLKVVAHLVRSSTNEANIREWLRSPDHRTRANVLESLAEIGREVVWIRQVLLDHVNDAHGRASANAAVGLYCMGVEEPALARLSEMALSRDPSVRSSAAWGMGQIPNIQMYEILNQLRTDAVSRVRWNALRSLSRLNRAGMKPRLASSGKPPRNRPVKPLAPPEPIAAAKRA